MLLFPVAMVREERLMNRMMVGMGLVLTLQRFMRLSAMKIHCEQIRCVIRCQRSLRMVTCHLHLQIVADLMAIDLRNHHLMASAQTDHHLLRLVASTRMGLHLHRLMGKVVRLTNQTTCGDSILPLRMICQTMA